MKAVFLIAALFLLAIFSSCSVENVESRESDSGKETTEPVAKTPVLIELFTSEGCSSCPPADEALAFLEKEQPFAQAEIITLALHVDYWNNLGWKDEFSSPLFSQRQAVYAQKLKLDSSYTPQMIVDGRIEFVGSDLNKAVNAVIEATKSPKAKIDARFDEDILTVKISDVPKHEDATVFLAVTESDLASNVKRGENAGKNLRHSSVVRELRPLGKIEAKVDSFQQKAAINLQKAWKKENLNLVVFVQENNSRRVLGTAKISMKK
jgi:hypothetical protein